MSHGIELSLEKLNLVTLIWIGLGCLAFLSLLFIRVPYGRHTRKGWGKLLDNRTGWFVMELPSFVIILLFLLRGAPSSYATMLGILWLLHYLNRCFVFPFRLRTKGKKMPISVVIAAIFFNSVNAGLNGSYLGFLDSYPTSAFMAWNFLVGLPLFLLGAVINLRSDEILLNLRNNSHRSYVIPKGGLFRWISCPNYLGEILEWGGFAVLAWNLPAASFLLWTVANLIPRAIQHHRWYREKFEEYPSQRKAIIPYLF